MSVAGAPVSDVAALHGGLPVVSVVMPLLGTPALLAASLASVTAQEGVAVALVLVAMPGGPDPAPLRRALPGLLAAGLRLLQLPQPADGGDPDPDVMLPAAFDLGIRSVAAGPVALLWPGDLFLPDRLAVLAGAMGRTGARCALSLVRAETAGPVPEALMLLPVQQMLDLAGAPGMGFALMTGNPQGAPGNLVLDRALYDLAGPLLPIGAAAIGALLLQATWWEEPLLVAEPLYAHRPRLPPDPARARLAQEVTLRRLFRRGLAGPAPNPRFPGAGNWPGHAAALARVAGWGDWFGRESGQGAADWRIYDRSPASIRSGKGLPG